MGKPAAIDEARLDRQLRIAGWDQDAVGRARICVVGDDDRLASIYVLSAAALGINQVVAIAPVLDKVLTGAARRLNPRLELAHIKGYYTYPLADDLLGRCDLIVDLSRFALAGKLLLNQGFSRNMPVIRGFLFEKGSQRGLRIFCYRRGREWEDIRRILPPYNLPAAHFDDGVLDIIAAGLVLEDTKNILMQRPVSPEVVQYVRKTVPAPGAMPKILVVGAGALGNFVGLGLAFSGFTRVTFMDPDTVETTNLNRQVLLYDAVGQSKAETLSRRLKRFYRMETDAAVRRFDAASDISDYQVVFDCVDNFESRIALSETCRAGQKVLISGGTGVETGQVIVYDPHAKGPTPAELLGLYDVVAARKITGSSGSRASCSYQPDPSVIMTNQVVAGFMVDACRRLLDGHAPQNIFYGAAGAEKW